jgi:glycosyltransferase involved in cell wall biosynthesis
MSNHTNITVFLGIYNGEKYLDSLFHQIKNQDTDKFKLLIVDNASTDNSFEIVKNWQQKLLTLDVEPAKNPRNLGAGGSLNLNLHRIETPWFITMHQDDFYKPNHVSTLIEKIKEASDEISGVSATMGSMTNEGKKMKPIPRSSWFSADLDKYGQFIQNIKSQTIPFPCTAFRTEVYKKTQVLIHNPSFSDTEQTLKMLCYGKFLFTQQETMLYRENPVSESHVLNEKEREIGAYIGLSRVFCSELFKNFIKTLEKEELFNFIKLLDTAVTERIRDSQLIQTIQIGLLENILESTGYEDREVLKLLSFKYQKFASPLTISILSNLGVFSIDSKESRNENQVKAPNYRKRMWDKYFLSRGFFPDAIHKIIVKFLYKLFFRFKPNHRWNTKWR